MALTNIAPDLKSLYFLWWNVRPEMIGNHVHNKAFFRNPEHKTNEWGSISHRDSEFFLCPMLVTRRKTSFLFIYRAQNFTSLLFYLGHYMYIETSSPRVKGETARLVSDRFKIADGHNWCLKFWYHMYGNSVGALKVKLKMYPFNPSKPYYNTKWADQYNHGDSWLFQQIQLNSADDFEVCWDINLSENWFRNTLSEGSMLKDDSSFSKLQSPLFITLT